MDMKLHLQHHYILHPGQVGSVGWTADSGGGEQDSNPALHQEKLLSFKLKVRERAETEASSQQHRALPSVCLAEQRKHFDQL